MKKIAFTAVMLTSLSGVVYAQSTPDGGNAVAGKAKSAVCAGCHGADGNSIAALFPKLAAQHPAYLRKQLHDFKTKQRNDPSMSEIAASLSDQDMVDLSAFYSGQKLTYQGLDDVEDPPKERVAQGKKLYRGGNPETGLPACNGCHGSRGAGNRPAVFPALKGQFAEYVAKTLNDFKDGIRSNDRAAMMRTTAGKMSEAEIEALAAYISTLQ